MRVISRSTTNGIEVFDADLQLVHTFGGHDAEGYAVASSLDRLALATDTGVICVDPGGRELWRWPQESLGGICAWSGDDALVWVYLPDAEAGRGEQDRWVALDAATGEPRVEHQLEITGQGGQQVASPDGRHMLLEVDEGQNGSTNFRADSKDLHTYPWEDRCLVAISPDGTQFLTVEHGQEDVAFHAFPGGEVQARVALAGFTDLLGPDVNIGEVFLEWTGGYLDDATAVVVISGEHSREGDWWRHFRVDARTGEVLGELGIVTIDAYDLKPLGDGTYVVTDSDGTLRRM
ncbi:hypothetical protein [Actinoplanes palleronii]|uniref:WD40 repeat protein n=1 Tax=Actinoplanes palleronii TaxID=113570 RepID=A0ABQ4BFA0_9ACTN|nr:hypothetical protein [Actinoplanes palleronii]GIE69011.1 hypothetical protein Apa02nite_051190 [Actinoplanes palleronii]